MTRIALRTHFIPAMVTLTGLAACGGDANDAGTNVTDLGSDVADTGAPEDTETPPEDTGAPEDTDAPEDTGTPEDTDAQVEVCTGPSTCDDGDPCTEDSVVSGSFATCDLECAHRSVADDADDPDDDFLDANCDGVDGTVGALVFVAPSGADAESCGTPAAPCATIGYAIGIAKAAQKSVAVSAGTYDERVTLQAGVHLHGGYDRDADWTRSADAKAIIASHQVFVDADDARLLEGMLAMGITTETIVDHLTVQTPDAPPEPYAISNHGVRVVASPGLVLRHMVITAGAKSGGAGDYLGTAGLDGADGNSTNGRAGAAATEARNCGPMGFAPAGAAGGNGGFDGVAAAAGVGTGSQPQAGGGSPGCGLPGGTAGRNWDNLPLQDTVGVGGGLGPWCVFAGAPGKGGVRAANFGALDASGLFSAELGGYGGFGVHGFGGTGGGGGGSGDADTLVKGADGGGGGGGSGAGCGGFPGYPGYPGGASIALLAVDSAGFVLDGSVITGGAGGAGGAGGDGGAGGHAGEPGKGGPAQATSNAGLVPHNSLAGGDGGRGSDGSMGGGGAGGNGGLSVGAMLCHSQLGLSSGDNTFAAGTAGAGGRGGFPYGDHGNDGLALGVFEGCALAMEVPLQLGYSFQPDTAQPESALVAFPEGTAAASWDGEAGTCGEGLIAIGATADLATAGGSWLCVPPASVNGHFFLQSSDRGLALELNEGAVAAATPAARGECPFGARVAFVEISNGATPPAATWVCYAPTPSVWRWEFRTSLEGWNPAQALVEGTFGGVGLEPTSADPWLTSPPLHIDTASLKHMVVRMSVNGGTIAGIYFQRAGESASEERVVNVPIAPTGELVDVTFDLGSHPLWTGVVTGVRFDFTNALGVAFIESISFEP